jgi:cysteine desulfuration protein SufE
VSINQIQDGIIEDFSQLDDWMDRYSMLIEMGNSLQPIDEAAKTPQNVIEGCQSRVWLTAEMRGGKVFYVGDSDAILVKGIVALLIKVMSGHEAQEILDGELYFIDRIGLKEHLSPTRSNGLQSMVKQMRLYAAVFKVQNNQD